MRTYILILFLAIGLLAVITGANAVTPGVLSSGSLGPAVGFFPGTQNKSTGGQKKQATKPGTKNATGKQKPAATTGKSKPSATTSGPVHSKAGMIAANQVDTFKLQVTPLVKFFESSLNFLADKRNPVNEKKTIITQSYLKWCWDEEVQVEDDLDENRLVPLHKDMPAYLSDVDFFFKQARFIYDVQDVSVETDARGLTYFKVTANRNLKGLTVNGDSVNSNKVRYLEINFDSVKQQLKIVSIYTTKLNEKEEMRIWWNTLPVAWKSILGNGKKAGDIDLASIESFNDTVAMVAGAPVPVDGNAFYQALSGVVNSAYVNLAGNRGIGDLGPLYKLSDLKALNLAGTGVSDLMPLRNLNNLTELNLSGTGVTTLDPLRYCSNITRLNISATAVSDLSVVPTYQALETLDISGTPVSSIALLEGMTHLKELNISNTAIQDLTPVAGLVTLEEFNFSGTRVTDLNPLQSLKSLKTLEFDSTEIRDLSPLKDLANLQTVSCNNSGVKQQEALKFLTVHPTTSLLYATKPLTEWWRSMTPDWRNTFNLTMELSDPPTPGQLHVLVLTDSINITGRLAITSLYPLQKLVLLRNLQCQSTGITGFDPLSGLKALTTINAANTKVNKVQPLSGCTALEILNIDNTQVADLTGLEGLKSLQLIFADNTPLDDKDALAFADRNPVCTLVYQTYENETWWQSLNTTWKEIFIKAINSSGNPDKIQLEKIAGLRKVTISENFQVADLRPLTHLKRLAELEFSGTTVSDLSPLAQISSLKALRCPKNPISDLTPVKDLPALTEIDFSNTLVNDLETIQNMVQLSVLKFNGTQIKNLKYLEKLVNLTVLEFYNTKVGNISVLDGMKRLVTVRMFNTSVSEKRAEQFRQTHPDCEVVFYKK